MCAVVFFGTVLLFSRAFVCGFVNYDDPGYVTANPYVTGGLTWTGVVWAFTAPNDYWHPLTWLSHMLDWQLFGGSASGHHVTSVLWHSANAVLAFLVFLRFAGGFNPFDKLGAGRLTAGGFWRSAFAAALFAWHPLRVESVAWVTERKDVMSGFFFLLTLLAYADYAAARAAKRRARGRYLLVLAFFVLGLMSKPMLVTLPLLLLVLDWWPLGRVSRAADWRVLVAEKIPLLVLSCAAGVATLLMQAHTGGYVLELSFVDRIGNAAVSLVRYLGKFVWPFELIACYEHPGSWPAITVLGAIAVLAGLAALAWRLRRSHPWIAAGFGWYLVTLLPVLGLVQAGFQAMADRYTYLSMLGIVLAAVWSVPVPVSRPARIAAACTAGLLLAACSWRAWDQEGVWKDSVSLFSHAVRVDKSNSIANDFLASAFLASGRLEEAAVQAAHARAMNPASERPLVTLAMIAEEKGDMDGAVSLYRKALEIRPDIPLVQCQLGLLELDRGNPDVARPLMTSALRSSRMLVLRTLELARGALNSGHREQARFLFETVLVVDPDDPEANAGLGIALLGGNDATGAIDHLRAAATRLPDRPDVQLALARCEQQLGHAVEAGRALDRAVRSAGPDASVLAGAADLYARRREFPTAIELFRRSIELAPDVAQTRAALGYLLIYTGDREGGISEWKRALDIEPDFPGLRERLRQQEK